MERDVAERYTAFLNGPEATVKLAEQLAGALHGGVIYLQGDLGTGKTSFVRAMLQVLGVTGRIKSPSYSLVECYALPWGAAWHLDLYRIADPDELEWLGLDALDESASLVLIEWPERGQGALPAPDLLIRLQHFGKGRQAVLEARTPQAAAWLDRLPASRHIHTESP